MTNVENNVETTEQEREKTSESQVLIIEMLQIIEKQEGMRKWKYKVKDNRFREFIMQTTIEPRDLPVTFKVGARYLVPISFNKSMKVANIDNKFIELIDNYNENEVIHSTIPVEEQGGTKEQIDLITKNDINDGVYVDSTFTDTIPKPTTGPTEQAVNDKLSRIGSNILAEKRVNTSGEGSQLAVDTTQGDEFQQMDKKDEQQILAEIKGHMIDEYVYQFPLKVGAGTRLVTGVSYAGIKALISRRGGYAITNNTIVEVNGVWYAKVMVHDKIQDIDGLGLGECPLHETFARQKAMSKALRNAYRSVLDEGQFKAFALQWLKENQQ